MIHFWGVPGGTGWLARGKKHWANAEQIQGTSTSYSICKNRGPSKTRCSFLEGPFTWLENGENIPFLLHFCGIRKHHPYPFEWFDQKTGDFGLRKHISEKIVYSLLSDNSLCFCPIENSGVVGVPWMFQAFGALKMGGFPKTNMTVEKNHWICIPCILLLKIWKHGDFPLSC